MACLSPLPPENEQQLLARAQALAGFNLGELAARAQVSIPKDLKRDKGWVGMLLELYLGPWRAASLSRISQSWALS